MLVKNIAEPFSIRDSNFEHRSLAQLFPRVINNPKPFATGWIQVDSYDSNLGHQSELIRSVPTSCHLDRTRLGSPLTLLVRRWLDRWQWRLRGCRRLCMHCCCPVDRPSNSVAVTTWRRRGSSGGGTARKRFGAPGGVLPRPEPTWLGWTKSNSPDLEASERLLQSGKQKQLLMLDG